MTRNSDKFGGAPETMLDSLASLARTALDDPSGLPDELSDSADARAGYAIDKLDEIIEALNPSTQDRESFARTLTVLGRHVAERQDQIEALLPDVDEADREAYEEAHGALKEALDFFDHAIGALQPEQDEDEYTCEDCSVNGEDCQTHGEAFKLAGREILRNPANVIALLRGEPFYARPEDVTSTVFDPSDTTFGPIMAALQAGDFEHAATLTGELAERHLTRD